MTRIPAQLPGRSPRRIAACVVAALLAWGLAPASPAAAEVGLIGHGPVLVGGWVEEENKHDVTEELGFALGGWAWRLEGPHQFDEFFGLAGLDFSWKVEALAGAILGDSESVEASVVPFFILEPASAERWVPFVEGGVGLAYSDLRGFDLGSRIHFSDNIGAGIARNLANDGLNSHFLVFSFE
jgi:hypothetical protein